MNDEEWDLLTGGLNRLGRIAKEKGMVLTFHHHMGTVVQTEEEIDRFMASVDPELVFLLFDSGHLSFAGIDPEKVLRKYVDRVRHVHLKDLRKRVVEQSRNEKWSFLKGVREGTFTVPGDGDVDFAPIFKILEEADYRGWVVVEAEQDPAKANPLEYALKARKYIAKHTGL
ncbi:inosose dehydratase [Lachnospiraceae bacterium]|nr:inosose dehydratase [Lachnospiraceae bacterium]